MSEGDSIYTVQIVNKAFEILDILSERLIQTDLPNLAEKVGMTRNKTYRLLKTLSEKGLVERDPVMGCYELG